MKLKNYAIDCNYSLNHQFNEDMEGLYSSAKCEHIVKRCPDITVSLESIVSVQIFQKEVYEPTGEEVKREFVDKLFCFTINKQEVTYYNHRISTLTFFRVYTDFGEEILVDIATGTYLENYLEKRSKSLLEVVSS